jgi:predicted ATPase
VLLQAAVLGREFLFEVLRSIADVDDERLISALEEAVAAQLVFETPDRSSLAYTFTHALVRETLYGGLSTPRRQRLHGRVAVALEERHGREPGPSLVDIAFHLCQAAPGGAETDHAVALAEQAAEWALERGAYEETVALLTRALTLVPAADPERVRRLTRTRAIAFQRLSHAAFDV